MAHQDPQSTGSLFTERLEELGCDDPEAYLEDFLAMMKAEKKPQARILSSRDLTFESGDYERSLEHLEAFMTPLLNSSEEETYPAVDLASGSCTYTVAWAHHFRRTQFKSSLEWYPTEWRGGTTGNNPLEIDLRQTLHFLANHVEPLFPDKNGKAIFVGDSIKLDGLRRKDYNGIHGVVVGPDPREEDRFAVQLGKAKKWKCCSFKKSNIVRADNLLGSEDGIEFEEAHEYASERSRFLRGLIDRSCELDMLDKQSWGNLKHIQGKCALITCANFITCVGYRNPDAWKDCLVLAELFLRPGGVFMAYDAKTGGFGNLEEMHAFTKSIALHLEPAMAFESSCGKMARIFWLKV